MTDLLIGVDGGGSRVRARLASAQGETLGTGEAGAANPHARGIPAAQNEILLAVQSAFDDAHIPRQIAAAACLGIGGIDRDAERAEWSAWARSTIASNISVVNDGEIVLAAGSKENWGIALISGTGSIAWGKSRAGAMERAGGWGHLLGDEGSAYDLSRKALRAVARMADGRGAATKLLDAILKEWSLREPSELIPRVYRSEIRPADVAHLAPLVVRIAQEGDTIAQQLVQNAAKALARTATTVARKLRFTENEIPLALTGGLMLQAESLRARLIEELNQSEFRFEPITLVQEPVTGAVRVAKDLLKTAY
jgi:N-acetylglucosamine kinase-like BadF-type ATPase